jgi:hypothetical protein
MAMWNGRGCSCGGAGPQQAVLQICFSGNWLAGCTLLDQPSRTCFTTILEMVRPGGVLRQGSPGNTGPPFHRLPP